MKIVHMVNYYMPGMGYQENYLPLCQQKLGHEVAIVTSNRLFPFENQNVVCRNSGGNRIVETGHSRDKGVEIFRLETAYENIAHTLLKVSYRAFMDKLMDIKPDIIHIHDYKNLNVFSALKYAKKSGARVFVDCHTDYRNNLAARPYLRKLLFNGFSRKLYNFFIAKKVRMFLPITESSQEFLEHSLGISSAQIQINRLGSDTEAFKHFSEKRMQVRRQLGYSGADIVYISTGKITYNKRYHLVCEAFNRLAVKYDNVKLLLIGSIENRISDMLRTCRAVRHLQAVAHDDLAGYYSAADVAVWPAPSVSIIDSMACGLPFVLYEELITKYLADSRGGILFKAMEDAFSAMETYIKEPNKRELFAKRASEYVLSNLSWGNIAKQSILLYNA